LFHVIAEIGDLAFFFSLLRFLVSLLLDKPPRSKLLLTAT